MRDLKVFRYFTKLANSISPLYVPALLLKSTIDAVLPFIGIIMPKLILDELMGNQNINLLIQYIVLVIGIVFILNTINTKMEKFLELKREEIHFSMFKSLSNVIMNVEYEELESKEFLNLKENAMYGANTWSYAELLKAVPQIISSLVSMAGTMYIILRFNYIILFLILLTLIINFFVQKYFHKREVEHQKESAKSNRAYSYFLNIMRDYDLNVDARVNMMGDYLNELNEENDQRMIGSLRSAYFYTYVNEGLGNVINIIQTGIVYLYIGVKTIGERLSIGSFFMYINAANTFNTSFMKFLEGFLKIRRCTIILEDVPVLAEYEIKGKHSTGKVIDTSSIEIEFKNLSFKYPNTNEYILKDINLIIKNNTRNSIVGRNGAGKTTLIKLLLGFYKPTSGEILINGVRIDEIEHQQFVGLMSAVFQDFKLFSFSIGENIAFNREGIEEEIWEVLNGADIGEYIKTLPLGLNTYIGKEYSRDGTDFSGGQKQKLAIARAVYKDSPLVILDEPTAALDPIAEAETYENFDKMVGGKTSVFISHRLSSCRFCDRILFLEDGVISEDGTHDELMALDGGYALMFNTQAQMLDEN